MLYIDINEKSIRTGQEKYIGWTREFNMEFAVEHLRGAKYF